MQWCSRACWRVSAVFSAAATGHVRSDNFVADPCESGRVRTWAVSAALSRRIGRGVAGRGSLACVDGQISVWTLLFLSPKAEGLRLLLLFLCLQTSVPARGRGCKSELRHLSISPPLRHHFQRLREAHLGRVFSFPHAHVATPLILPTGHSECVGLG